MPRLANGRIPQYRKHRARGQAICTIGGRDNYLGPYGTKASRLEYDRLIGEWLAAGRPSQWPPPAEHETTIAELLVRYLAFAKGHYRNADKPTRYMEDLRPALKPLRELYSRTLAADFGPLALKAIRDRMIAAGWSRKYVNQNVDKLKRIFKWAVSEQLIPPSVYEGLRTVAGLQRGRTEAPETDPVQPVSEADFQAALPHLPEVVADMVRFHRLAGCRPAEVCILRPCDVDRSGDVWVYRPSAHKTDYRGRERLVFIGPKAQDVLRPYLLRAADAFCFSPVESETKRRAEQHAKRKTPLSCGNRPGTNKVRRRRRPPADRYDVNTYARAVQRGCDKAGVPRWSPNRLRHSAATEIRSRFGLEAAQVILGHSKADVTQVYAERDIAKGVEVARLIG